MKSSPPTSTCHFSNTASQRLIETASAQSHTEDSVCIVRGLYVQELASMCINLIAKILNPVHPQSPKLFMLPDEEQDNGHDRLPPCPRMMWLWESCHWGSGRTRQCDQPVCARSGSAVPRVGLHDIAPCLAIQYQWSTFRKLIISTTYYSFFFSYREGRGKETEEGRWKGIKKFLGSCSLYHLVSTGFVSLPPFSSR